MTTYQVLNNQWKRRQLVWKVAIGFSSGSDKFKLRIKFLLLFPFQWIYINIRDWHTFLIFAIVFLVVSSEVWVPYLLYIILKLPVLLAIGSACWLFWLGPGTPFLLICILLTMLIKAGLNKWKK